MSLSRFRGKGFKDRGPKNRGGLLSVILNQITHITASGEYSYVHTDNGREFITSRSLNEWEIRLPDLNFCRIHRSTIINFDYIVKIDHNITGNAEVVLQGLPIGLVKDNNIVWADGFGFINSFTGNHVSTNTRFEVASISKVVTAYIALRLVDEGKLSLDKPLLSYLSKEWMPYSIYQDSIRLLRIHINFRPPVS